MSNASRANLRPDKDPKQKGKKAVHHSHKLNVAEGSHGEFWNTNE